MAWLVGLAVAGVPEGVTPVAAAADVPAAFAAWAKSRGQAALTLPCSPLIERQVLMCYRLYEGDSRRWVTSSDLQAWAIDEETLREVIRERAFAVAPNVLQPQRLDGFEQGVLATTGDRWAIAPVLHPEALMAALGATTVFAALPAEDMLIAWAPGDEELDRAASVGVTELHGGQEGGVSPLVFRYVSGQGWAAWMEAVAPE